VVDESGKQTRFFAARIPTLLRLAATDARVDRIFVNPGVKRALCEKFPGAPHWLRKIRPWWSHDVHFHVRLACPGKSRSCIPQEPLPPGTGCKELDWWFDERAQAARKESRKRYREKIGKAPLSPERCSDVAAAR
jgi:penicillin-insensitive murein endopeptidase